MSAFGIMPAADALPCPRGWKPLVGWDNLRETVLLQCRCKCFFVSMGNSVGCAVTGRESHKRYAVACAEWNLRQEFDYLRRYL